MMVIARKAHPEELERIAAFYHDNDYRPAISPADVIVVAENEDALYGVVRICDEHDALVLRGMRVGKDMRRRGSGAPNTGANMASTSSLCAGQAEQRHVGPARPRPNSSPQATRATARDYRSEPCTQGS